MSTIIIAWRNLGRHKKRTALAILAIAIGQFGLLATAGIMRGYTDNIHRAITGALIGQAQIHAVDWRDERALDLAIDDDESMLQAVLKHPDVDSASSRIYAPALVAPKRDAFFCIALGVQMDKEARMDGLLPSFDQTLPPKAVLVGHILARKALIKKGDEIALIGQGADGSTANDLFTVAEIIKSPSDLINQRGIVMNLATAQEFVVMPNQTHEIVIRARSDTDAKALTDQLKKLPELSHLEILPWQEILPEFVLVLKIADYAAYIVLVLVFIAAIAGVANTLMMSTFERRHEFGMLLALGSRPRRLIGMIIFEALFLGALGLLLGTVLGYGFVLGFSNTGIDMASWGGGVEVNDIAYKGLNLPLMIFPRLTSFDVFLGVATIVFTSLVASIWPAWVTSRLEPVEAMNS